MSTTADTGTILTIDEAVANGFHEYLGAVGKREDGGHARRKPTGAVPVGEHRPAEAFLNPLPDERG